jgi:hypothetical protein
VEEPLLSSGCESSDTGDDSAVNHRVPSLRRVAAVANTKMTQQCCSCSDEGSEFDAYDESHSDREDVRPVGLTLGGRHIVESDEEEDGSDCEREDGGAEPHCDDPAEVGDDEFDESIYTTPDELGFVAVKPGPKQRVGSSWRDATYIRIYGCASYYLKWQFKNVVKNVEYCIDYVVKNCSPENDNDEMYY